MPCVGKAQCTEQQRWCQRTASSSAAPDGQGGHEAEEMAGSIQVVLDTRERQGKLCVFDRSLETSPYSDAVCCSASAAPG